jgi:type I restriction enzyme, S subunit
MTQMWPTVPLGRLVEGGVLSYGIVQPGGDVPDGVRIVRVKDLKDGQIDVRHPLKVAPSVSARHARTVLRGGELLISIVGTIGEAAVVPASLAGWNVARAIAVVRPSGVSADWISLALRTRDVRTAMLGMLNTTVQATLNLADLKGLQIPMPPEHLRAAIVEVIHALDSKAAANSRVASSAVMLADALFQRAALSPVEWTALGDVATTALGGTPSRDRADYWTNGTVPWIASGKANEERVLEPSEWITPEALANSAAKLMPRGATVLAITGATLGQVARLEIETSGNQSLIGVWHEAPALNDWIYFAVRQEIGELLRHATGAAQQHVNKAAVEALRIPVLESDRTLRSWGEAVRPMLDLAAAKDRESLGLAGMRDRLLPLLMAGKVRVRDAEKVVEGVA